MFRWFRSDGVEALRGNFRYFFFIPTPGLVRLIAPKIRGMVTRFLACSGVTSENLEFYEEHFYRTCAALEGHFARHPAPHFLLATPHPTLADVVLGAAFTSGFLHDDPPASCVFEKYPHLAAYIERITGWRGGVFVGKKEGPEEAVGPADAAAGEDGAYPDEVPESLSAFFENIIEVLPFMVSQCTAFKAYMTSDAVRTLRREPLGKPWKGCHGYLFPQITKIRSMMIIDNLISNIHIRAQDIELAFLAAREVCDETLREFNRLDPAVEAEAPPPNKAGSHHAPCSLPDSIAAEPRQGPLAVRPENSLRPYDKAEGGTPEGCSLEAAKALRENQEETQQNFFTTSELEKLDSESADFYRVFTKKGLLNRSTVQLRKPSSTAGGRAASRVPHEKGVMILRSSIADHLQMIRSIMSMMECPHYTLSTVFHGRRVYVAAIPEYEVDKIRRQKT
ncbi:unnamed protein product [Phytomonas sp. Hart1]|nr:unnamed protein product [Phytomonas sp. Hart1]|eukprot:CCW69952.1 unnamed protein product [Phytomonas sp. isolate Hart1]